MRATIEAYSQSRNLEGYDEATACGIKLEGSKGWEANLRVTSKGTKITNKLDRWE